MNVRWALGGLLVVAGCDGASRRDAETVVIAVTRFRIADNANTPAAVDALEATPCGAPDVCETRDVCLVAAKSTKNALILKSEVEQSLSRLEKGTLSKDDAEAQALPKKLDDAESLLQKGHDGLPACDDHVQALKRKHRI